MLGNHGCPLFRANDCSDLAVELALAVALALALRPCASSFEVEVHVFGQGSGHPFAEELVALVAPTEVPVAIGRRRITGA